MDNINRSQIENHFTITFRSWRRRRLVMREVIKWMKEDPFFSHLISDLVRVLFVCLFLCGIKTKLKEKWNQLWEQLLPLYLSSSLSLSYCLSLTIFLSSSLLRQCKSISFPDFRLFDKIQFLNLNLSRKKLDNLVLTKFCETKALRKSISRHIWNF